MKYLLFCFVSLLLSSCATPSNPEFWMETQQNACLPTAIAFREGLKKYDVWSEVVIYNWLDRKTNRANSHAIVAYMYPSGKNQLWTYDYKGSYRAIAYKNDPLQIAKEAVRARQENVNVSVARFLN